MISELSRIPLQALEAAQHCDLVYVDDHELIKDQVREWGFPDCDVVETRSAKAYVARDEQKLIVFL